MIGLESRFLFFQDIFQRPHIAFSNSLFVCLFVG